MNIDYNDEKFKSVESEKKEALKNVRNTYDSMIKDSDKYYDNLSNVAEEYGNKQQELQQQKTDFAIDQINQNKDWTKQDYTKEQKAAYQDYRKESNQYGVNAEQMAQNGLLDTGYAETSRVSMYNTYQNRVATARESFNRSIVEYDNQIKDAQLSNNSVLAELAYNTLKTKLEYSLQGFQYKNTLIQSKLSAENEVDDRYYNRWKDVLSQMNTEKQYQLSLSKLNGNNELELDKNDIETNKNVDGENKQTNPATLVGASLSSLIPKSSANNYSPNLSSEKAREWYSSSSLNSGKNKSTEEVKSTLQSAYKDNKITDEDVYNILKSYGLE